jgi:acetyl esterase/lipase
MSRARAVAALLLVLILAGCASMAPVLNLLISHAGYSVKEDLAYGRNPRQKLDVYTPDHLTGKAPVILFLYGGSWQTGNKEQYLAFGESFATKGIIVAIADYRVYPEVRYPDFLKDGAAALAYVHAHIAEYGGDPDRIFIAGHSAGAYIAVMLAADPHYLDDAGARLSWVHGVIGIAGPYDFLPLTDPTIITIFGTAPIRSRSPISTASGRRCCSSRATPIKPSIPPTRRAWLPSSNHSEVPPKCTSIPASAMSASSCRWRRCCAATPRSVRTSSRS